MDRVSGSVKILAEYFLDIINNVCSLIASRHYEPTFLLPHAFGQDIGYTQVAYDITRSYWESIHNYLDFFLYVCYMGNITKTE